MLTDHDIIHLVELVQETDVHQEGISDIRQWLMDHGVQTEKSISAR